MAREIKNVFVSGISLVSSKHTPAVEQAESWFALFKTVKKSDICQWCDSDYCPDCGCLGLNKISLEKIQSNLNIISFQKIQKNLLKK